MPPRYMVPPAAITDNTRRILQVYWGHQSRANLSDVSVIPPRLWRDHSDPEVRRFYSKHSRFSRVFNEAMGNTLVSENITSRD